MWSRRSCFLCGPGGAALGIDYSSAAIDIANTFREGLSSSLRDRMRFLNIDAATLPEDVQYDYIFMIEVWEHMYDHQISPLLEKCYRLLKSDGKLILTTPNGFYERYLYPAKRIFNIPVNLFKWPLRIVRRKWMPASFGDFLRHVFKVQAFSNTFMDQTHVNISSPVKIRRMLGKSGFKVRIKCSDSSKDLLSLIFSRWAGREMLIVASK